MADDRKVAFNWYLNRQGPRGPQGVKGDTGFSPNITVETDTLNEYILRITNEGGYFLTSNLREHKEDRGGTYIRYDRENGTMYAGEADTATDTKAGIIKIATADDVEAEDEFTAVTPAILAEYVAGIGGGSGDVTLAGDNSFTGNNTFDGETTFNGHTWTAEQEAATLNVTSNATLKNAYVTGTISSLGELTAVSISAAGIKNNQNDKYYLNQASITAGSDNLVIAETETGIKLVVNAPTDAQFGQLQKSIADLSTKINGLTDRVKALEERIDGGVA